MSSATAPTAAENPSSGPPASWQTIFWILTCLAINSMAQPGGRICGLPSRYRTYLRCSPLTCAADILSIFIRLLVSAIYQRLSLLESLGILLHKRFNSTEEIHGPLEVADEDDDGIQSLERMTWLRWLWFLLGALPPAIKLLSMAGVGWSKAWGSMFLISWTVNELLVIFAMFNQSFFTVSRTGRISWAGFEQTTQSPGRLRTQRVLDTLEKCLAVAVLITHVILVNSVFRIISKLSATDYPLSSLVSTPLSLPTGITLPIEQLTAANEQLGFNTYAYRYADPEYTLFTSLGMWIGVGTMEFLLQNQSLSLVLAVFSALFYLMLVNTIVNVTLVYSTPSVSSVNVWALTTATISVFLLLTRFVISRFDMLGRNLLVLYRNIPDGHSKVDYGGSLSLVFFLSTLLATVLWYGYIYESTGTSVPVWTGVFG